jgi:uncharacterized Rmd1/YagE family protein
LIHTSEDVDNIIGKSVHVKDEQHKHRNLTRSGMYSVHMDFHAHQLIKFIKKIEKIHTCSFDSTSSMYKI